ncbi:hypothetical protein Nepgr_030252 [Nepenthes gracilis]|uniref:Uncharacterized protein n=1 Tax=Nepenthes gracilis TaxID=150966 RepID=A0AAD3Y5W5_NEPGR|nr:hypothetical protein Nepgr_030252 [Nepenthes gracilis]
MMQSKPSDLLAIVFICFISISTAVNAIGEHHQPDHQFGWLIPSTTSISTCRGTIADCIAGEEELEIDSEINRRMLAPTKYISYDAQESISAAVFKRKFLNHWRRFFDFKVSPCRSG